MYRRLLLSALLGLPLPTLLAQPTGLVDPTFRPVFNQKPDAVLPLPDGRVYVAGNGLTFTIGNRVQEGIARLNRDGSVDPTFDAGSGLEIGREIGALRQNDPSNLTLLGQLTGSLTTVSLIAQPDGKIVAFVGMVYGKLGFSAQFLVARFHPDGSRDSSFKPDFSLRYSPTLPSVLPDGRWLKIVPGVDEQNNRVVFLNRFTSNGAADPAFGTQRLVPSAPAVAVQYAVPTKEIYNERYLYVTDRLGRAYLGTYHSYRPIFLGRVFSSGDTNPKTSLFRLLPDGTPDTTFVPKTLDEILALRSTDQGIVCHQNRWLHGIGTTFVVDVFKPLSGGTTTLLRLAFDGTPDSTFRPTTSVSNAADYDKLTTAPDGSVYAITRGQSGHRGIVRYDPSGAYDSDFSVELGDTTSQITELFPQPDGQLLVFGTFTSIAGVAQPYLARLTPNTRASATRFSNLSVRALAGSGSETIIAGFLSTGGETNVLARAAGPALTQFRLEGALADPQLAFFNGSSPVTSNDDWDASPSALIATTAARLNAFPFPAGSRDAAFLATAPAGAHTLQVTSADSSTGVALLELYDAGPPPADAHSPRLANFSARTLAGVAPAIQIVGFTLAGDRPRNLLIRAVGPALAKFGVTGPLADPLLTLFRENSAIARNDNWQDGTADEVFLRTEATAAVSAFPLDPASKDSVLVVTLAPGRYTAQVTGPTTGIALVEVYEIP